jgi:hypothetical protein
MKHLGFKLILPCSRWLPVATMLATLLMMATTASQQRWS